MFQHGEGPEPKILCSDMQSSWRILGKAEFSTAKYKFCISVLDILFTECWHRGHTEKTGRAQGVLR